VCFVGNGDVVRPLLYLIHAVYLFLGGGLTKHQRWRANKLNKDLFREVIEFRVACIDLPQENCDWRAKWLSKTLAMACDIASERVRPVTRQRSKYWWNDEISEHRRDCVAARRRLTRARRRNNPEEIETLSSSSWTS